MRLSSISPNSANITNNSNPKYSSLLAQAAKSVSDSFSFQLEHKTTLKHKLITKYEHLNENSTSSMDSGYGSVRTAPSSQLSPSSLEIQLIQSQTSSQASSICNRPSSFKKKNLSDTENNFSDSDLDSNYNYDEDEDDNDLFKFNSSDSDSDEPSKKDTLINDSCAQKSNLNISNCSNSSFSFQTRRCLFKSSPSPAPTALKSLINNSTPNKVVLIKTPIVAESSSSSKQITPISTYRNNIITNEQPALNDTSILEYSISSIEKSLEIFCQNNKPQQIKQTITHTIDRISEDEDECLKETHELIMKSLDVMETDQQNSNSRLIGDRSRYHILPCTTSIKHNDLNVITKDTLIKVLDGKFDAEIDKLFIIDSRYPYEFEGGHIRNAENVYTKEKIIEMFLENREGLLSEVKSSSSRKEKRVVIIFHCEFSSERGPSLLRFLRNMDRTANRDAYPKLFYPELYLLEGGYKAFYEQYADYCDPKTYKPMLHEDHVQDLKHFRAKTKTWEAQHKHASGSSGSAYKSGYVKSSLVRKLQRFPKSTLF